MEGETGVLAGVGCFEGVRGYSPTNDVGGDLLAQGVCNMGLGDGDTPFSFSL